jgi:hypothetical protein
MWKRYFKFIKLKPGRVVTALFGELDFSRDDIPVETIKTLYESDFPYLKITDAGLKEFYGIGPLEEISIFPPEESKAEITEQAVENQEQIEEPESNEEVSETLTSNEPEEINEELTVRPGRRRKVKDTLV